MKEKKAKIVVMWLVVAAIFVISLMFYPKLPPQIASHWNAAGKVNNYMSKFWGTFLLPLVMLALLPLLLLLPKIDPLHKNVASFYNNYLDFLIAFTIFMLLVQLQVLLWNVGIKLNINAFIPILVGFLLYFAGVLIEKAKRNWFIGIRTPWTLSSDIVWKKTHKIGALLFKICALFAFLGAFFNKYSIYFIFVPLIVVAVYLVVYSYREYEKELAKK